jgi:hypothetical protein
MKHQITLILLYIAQAFGYYLIFCTIGLIWFDWHTIIYGGWNIPYWMLVGWWLPIPACYAYYDEYIK